MLNTFLHCDRWDTVTGDLVLVEDIDGHSDMMHGVYDPKFHRRFQFMFTIYIRFS
jgi:hypothetical protein